MYPDAPVKGTFQYTASKLYNKSPNETKSCDTSTRFSKDNNNYLLNKAKDPDRL